MPKVISIPVKTHAEVIAVKKLTDELNASLREHCDGAVTTRIVDLIAWLGWSRNTVLKLLKGVNRIGKTKYYHTIDIARKLALDTVNGNIKTGKKAG